MLQKKPNGPRAKIANPIENHNRFAQCHKALVNTIRTPYATLAYLGPVAHANIGSNAKSGIVSGKYIANMSFNLFNLIG